MVKTGFLPLTRTSRAQRNEVRACVCLSMQIEVKFAMLMNLWPAADCRSGVQGQMCQRLMSVPIRI